MTERDFLAAAIIFLMFLIPTGIMVGVWPLIKDELRRRKKSTPRRKKSPATRRTSPRRRTTLKSARS